MSFNIGTSSTINATTEVTATKMDMSLDDIIKTSRRSVKKSPSTGGTNAKTKNPNANASRATGTNKARRNAQINARRGIANDVATNKNGTNKPTSMEIERQVNRQQRGGGGRSNANASGVPQGNAKVIRGGRQQSSNRPTAPSEGSVRAKARNAIIRAAAAAAAAAAKSNTTTNTGAAAAAAATITAPSQQAIAAAAKAMKELGFKCPKGMMMQISFVPKPGGGASNTTTSAVITPRNNQNQTGRGGGRNNRGGGRGGGGRGGGR